VVDVSLLAGEDAVDGEALKVWPVDVCWLEGGKGASGADDFAVVVPYVERLVDGQA
jgi:hypothetical protein